MAKSKEQNRRTHKEPRERLDNQQRDSEDSNTKDKITTERYIQLDDWQRDFLATKGDKILCTGRQVGKSVVCSEDAGEFAVNNPNSEPIVMIAPTERQAYALFDKTLNYLATFHPKSLITKGLKRPTKQRITLRSGVKIYCLPVGASGLGIRFLTIGRLYIDEASRVPEEVWSAIVPALLVTGGDTIMLSTPAGAQGEFYRCFINEDSAYDSFTRFSIDSEKVVRERVICSSWKVTTRDKALIKLEQAKARMSNKQYNQEFMGKFIEGLSRWFSDDIIAKCCSEKKRTHIEKNREYYMGVDIARMGEDEGTIEIIERTEDMLIHIENIVTRKKLTTETEDNILAIDSLYNCKQIGIDAGAGTLGVSILDHLLRVSQVKKKVVAINNAQRPLNRDGTKKARLVKEDLYENLRALMERGKIKLLDDDEVIASLKSVQFEYVTKQGEPTKLRIFGNYTHIVEGLIRAAQLANQKHLNFSISWI